MSADLLRRAAAVLREHAEAATAGPWDPDSHDFIDDDRTVYMALGPDDGHGNRPIPFQTVTNDSGAYSQAEADIDYGVLMHPPVALALADLLDAEAGLMVATSAAGGHRVEAARALAQAVLRGGA